MKIDMFLLQIYYPLFFKELLPVLTWNISSKRLLAQFLLFSQKMNKCWGDLINSLILIIFQLGILDTPIHEWKLPNVPKEYKIFIKRDDMTGSTLSGNKVCFNFFKVISIYTFLEWPMWLKNDD